ncbi:hypothetical protein KVR01_007568 [Diaporthe batatas]|uniref:uncharacterized protein n=1 Tax=Diaporthe batatas TaxID=748121 RepID=UPI001D040D97|nr:uncharacterized protein KVR01_007568 [Diaporthe batatas]KAG8163090.1 hypothetical protein KVR01_007568 [Diaporthe batatas]
MGHNLARRLCAYRNMPRLCLPPSGPRPAFRLNPFLFLVREQHGSAHPPLAQHPQLFAGLGDKIFETSREDLEPSTTRVSQDSGFKVVSTFNAIPGTASPVAVPGSPPSWKAPKLPWRLPETAREASLSEVPLSDQKSMLDLSLKIKHSDFEYDGVDVVTRASLLVKLLMFCRRKNGLGLRRFSLRMTQDTLLIADDPSVMSTRVGPTGALRSVVTKHCAEPAPGLEHSTHYRSVQYQLGQVNCVVQSEVGVLRSAPPSELPRRRRHQTQSSQQLAVNPVSGEPALIQIYHKMEHQRTEFRGPLKPLHWFSRIPVALIPRFAGNGETITEFSKYNVTEAAGRWEKEEMTQVWLRKLATLLSELKKAVKAAAPDGQECIGILDRQEAVPTIQLYLAEGESKRAPEDIGSKPELGETSRGQEEALGGGGPGPTTPA